MGKLFAITNKKGNPMQFGNSRKSAWKTHRWIEYHLKRRSNKDQYDIHTIDFVQGTVHKTSAIAFLASLQDPEEIKIETFSRFGFSADLSTLEGLVKTKALSEPVHYLVVKFLELKGINVNNL